MRPESLAISGLNGRRALTLKSSTGPDALMVYYEVVNY